LGLCFAAGIIDREGQLVLACFDQEYGANIAGGNVQNDQDRQKAASQGGEPPFTSEPTELPPGRPVLTVHALSGGPEGPRSETWQVRQVGGDRLELYVVNIGPPISYARVNLKLDRISRVYKVEIEDDGNPAGRFSPLFVLETISDEQTALDFKGVMQDKREGRFWFTGFAFRGYFTAVLSVYSTATWKFEATLRGSELSWQDFSFHANGQDRETVNAEKPGSIAQFIDPKSREPRKLAPVLASASAQTLGSTYPYQWKLNSRDPVAQATSLLRTSHLDPVISGYPQTINPGDMPVHVVPFPVPMIDRGNAKGFLSLMLVLADHRVRLASADVFDYAALTEKMDGTGEPLWANSKRTGWSIEQTSALRLAVRPALDIFSGPGTTGSPNLPPTGSSYTPARKIIVEIHSTPSSVFVTAWNRLLGLFLRSLKQNRAGNPVSLLPRFTSTPGTANWVLSYALYDAIPSSAGRDIRFTLVESSSPAAGLARYAKLYSLRPGLLSGGPLEEVLDAEFPNLNSVDHRGPVTGLKVPIRVPGSPDRNDAQDGTGLYFALNSSIRATASAPGQLSRRIRFGSFDLSIAEEPTPTAFVGLTSQGSLPDDTPVSRTSSGRLNIGTDGQVLVDSKLDIAMRSWAPGGQDNPPAEEFAPTNFSDYGGAVVCEAGMLNKPAPEALGRGPKWDSMFQDEVPLTIYLPSSSNRGTYVLEATEANAERISHTIDLRTFVLDYAAPAPNSAMICQATDSKQLERVFVIDRNPFLVARVAFQPIGTSSPFANVGRWTNRADQPRGWQVSFAPAKGGSPVCVTLPPQGLGETMLDQRNVALSDGEASQHNFTPNTNLYLSLAEEGLSFTTAPWDLRSMFSNPQLAPYVQQIDYELLYGLSCVAQTPLVRLLDTFGAIGHIPAQPAAKLVWEPLPSDRLSQTVFDQARQEWAFVYRRYRNRLSVLEPVPWNAAATQAESITLNQNLACWFRLPDASNLQLPVTLEASDVPNATRLAQLNAGTLAGGATRGFVSKNVYIASVLLPSDHTLARMSSSAQLSQFAFTALGGDGKQMAGFQNNLTRIYGDVHFGRAYRYKVERIGRIACFWNTAKHVVVYERRVAPAPQFAEDGKQYKGLGWPFLRKVQEYVEIIDDKLEFPSTSDVGNTSQQQLADLKNRRGCVTGIQFEPGARFNVSSDWGIDVGDSGWKIPLWNPTADQSIYPRPRFDLRMAPQESREKEFELKRFAKPDQVFFFTLTKLPGTNKDPDGDPRKWPAQPDIDFCNCPDPKPVADFRNGDPRQYSAPERPSTQGFSPCTFDLETAGAPVNLMADRSGSPMAVQLSTITVSRSMGTNAALPQIDPTAPFDPAKLTDPSYVLAALRQIESRLTDVFQQLLHEFPVNAVFEPGLGTRIKNEVLPKMLAELGKLRDEVNKLRTQLASEPFSPQNLKNKISQVETDAKTHVFGRIDQAVNDAKTRANTRIQELQAIGFTLARGRSILSDFGAEVAETLLLLGSLPSQIDRFVVRMVGLLNAHIANVKAEFNAALQRIRTFSSPASVTLAQCQAQLRIEFARVNALEDEFFRSCAPFLPQGLTDCFAQWRAGLSTYFGLFDTHLSEAIKAADLTAFRVAINKDLTTAVNTALDKIDQIKSFLVTYTNLAIQAATNWADLLKRLEDSLPHTLATISDPWQKAINDAIALTYADVNSVQNKLNELAKLLQDANGAIRQELVKYADAAQAGVDKAAQLYNDAFQAFYSKLSNAETELKRIADDFEKNANQLQGELIRYKDNVVNSARDWAEQNTKPLLDKLAGSGAAATAYQAGDTALRLVRAFGDPPRTAQMRFEQSQLGYYFKQALPGVDLSPAYLALDQGAAALDALRPLGLRLPCNQILDQLIPSPLKNFDFSNIFPNFAGIDFSHLLSGFKVPDALDSRHVKVQHGIDAQRRRAFVKAEVNFDLDKTATILDFGPVRLDLPTANFHSFLSIAATESGIDERQVSGSLFGTWRLALSGIEILSLTGSTLLFDDHGGLHFQIDPFGVKLPDFLKFVTEKLAGLIDPNSGLSFGSIPKGFRCTLDLPVPDTGGLTTGVSGLRLSTSLALLFDGDFQIELGCGLGRPEAPFNVAFFILGGGGYLTTALLYTPSKGQLACTINFAITASASLAIALGPIRGGVYVYLGVTAKFQTGGSANAFGVVFVIRGDVSLCGIVSASITLSLSASYKPDDGTLTGTGRLVISIKICWCFTLSIDESISYSLKAGNAKQSLNRREPIYLAYGNGTVSDAPLLLAQTLAPPPAKPSNNPRLLTPREAAKKYSRMLV
jgi:hypothetical protein